MIRTRYGSEHNNNMSCIQLYKNTIAWAQFHRPLSTSHSPEIYKKHKVVEFLVLLNKIDLLHQLLRSLLRHHLSITSLFIERRCLLSIVAKIHRICNESVLIGKSSSLFFGLLEVESILWNWALL